MGLYTYPMLMAADILLFSADLVPVGEDQLQHVEIARDISIRFNNNYGELLRVPEAMVRKDATLPGLDGRKMSKSYGNNIPLFMDPKKLRKLVMKIKTDSLPPEAPKNPDDSLIFGIYREFATGPELQALRERYEKGIGWGEAKEVLYEKLESLFGGARDVYSDWMNRKDDLDKVLSEGCEKARDLCAPLMHDLRRAVGVRRK
jgi:tryptophanyl-tRNA synthetase